MAERPWGGWEIIHTQPGRTVKVLTVKAGAMLSLQSHKNRRELWQPVESGLIAYVANPPHYEYTATLMHEGSSHFVGNGAIHRLINPTARDIAVIEIIVGEYDEDDIIRYHDSYGRV